jgi:voltage-gated potassium channel
MIKKYSNKDNFSYLLFSLIFLLLSGACVDEFLQHNAKYLTVVVSVISMSIGVWSIQTNRFAFKTGLGLVISVIFVASMVYFLDQVDLDYIHLIFMLVFFILTLKLSAQQVLFSGQITKNSLVGSICIYLLLAMIWTITFLLLFEFIPDSFSGVKAGPWYENFQAFTYFSFVTLTSLGYGDILPISPIARFLVYMEVIVGTFYMAIFVSSLVGAKMSEQQSK